MQIQIELSKAYNCIGCEFMWHMVLKGVHKKKMRVQTFSVSACHKYNSYVCSVGFPGSLDTVQAILVFLNARRSRRDFTRFDDFSIAARDFI